MAASREFLEYVLDQMALFGGATARRMFGGAGIYRDGVMFARGRRCALSQGHSVEQP